MSGLTTDFNTLCCWITSLIIEKSGDKNDILQFAFYWGLQRFLSIECARTQAPNIFLILQRLKIFILQILYSFSFHSRHRIFSFSKYFLHFPSLFFFSSKDLTPKTVLSTTTMFCHKSCDQNQHPELQSVSHIYSYTHIHTHLRGQRQMPKFMSSRRRRTCCC